MDKSSTIIHIHISFMGIYETKYHKSSTSIRNPWVNPHFPCQSCHFWGSQFLDTPKCHHQLLNPLCLMVTVNPDHQNLPNIHQKKPHLHQNTRHGGVRTKSRLFRRRSAWWWYSSQRAVRIQGQPRLGSSVCPGLRIFRASLCVNHGFSLGDTP